MTLIITALCDDFLVQVSDRRFVSAAGGVDIPVTDEGNKQVVVNGPDYRFVAGFTGLASVETRPDANLFVAQSTGWWLASVIGQGEVLSGGMEACVESVREAADVWFRKLHARSSRRWPLTVLFAGYRQSDRVPTIAKVTNCEAHAYRPSEVSEGFTAEFRHAVGRECISAGVTAALAQEMNQRVRAVLKRRDYPATTDVLVQAVREAAGRAKFRKYVSANCTSVFLPRFGQVESIYHPLHQRPETFGPNIVDYAAGAVMVAVSPRVQVFGIPPVGTGLLTMGVGPNRTLIRDRRTLKRKLGRPQG